MSLANLCWIGVWVELFFLEGNEYYVGFPPTRSDYLAAILGVSLLAGSFTILLGLGHTFPRYGLPIARLGLLATVLLPLNVMRVLGLLPVRVGRLLAGTGSWEPAAILACGLVVLSFSLWWSKQMAKVVRMALVLLFPFAIITLGRSTFGAVVAQPSAPWETPRAAASRPQSVSDGRVIWIVFDELDQGVLYARRPRGLVLPAFDTLRSESTWAADALPPSSETLLSLPALITGTAVVAASPDGASELMLTLVGGGVSVRWSQQPNVFSRLREVGVRSGVVGWYHPYCRVLAKDLDTCQGEPSFETVLGRSRDRQFLGRLSDQFHSISPANRRRLAIDSYRKIHAAATRALASRVSGLTFIHYPVPHVPAIFDPKTNQLSLTVLSHVAGYIGNLVLADRTLASVRQTMEAAGTWDSSTILVTSDHHWRESRLYDGVLDRRVPFLLKLAGQKSGVEIGTAINTLCSTDLIVKVIKGELANPDDVAAWLVGRHPPANSLSRTSSPTATSRRD